MPHAKLRPGDPAPDFDLPGVDGARHRLSVLLSAHRAVVVMFSCNHCPYVVAYEDRFNELQRDYQSRGVTLIAVNPNNEATHPADSLDQMVVRARAKGFAFPYLRDLTQETALAYGAQYTPECYLVDAGGVVRYIGRIDDNWEDARAVRRHDLREAIDAVLSGRPVLQAQNTAVGCTIKWKPENRPR